MLPTFNTNYEYVMKLKFKYFRTCTIKMENSHYEESDSSLLSRQQSRLRAALAKLSDVCQRNSKLTEAVLSKQSSVASSNNKSKVASAPPPPPLRTVSLFKIKTLAKVKTKKDLRAQTKSEIIISEVSDKKTDNWDTSNILDPGVRENSGKNVDTDSLSSSAEGERSERVRRSLENLTVPSWYTKYHRTNGKKWIRERSEESIT